MSQPTIEMITMHDNEPIQTARFDPQIEPKGVVQIIHGFGEYMGQYKEVAEFFVANDYACVFHEQRGFGDMPHKTQKQRKLERGLSPGYPYFLNDTKTIRNKIDNWYPNKDVFLFGHSMGGNIAINYLLENPNMNYKKAILEAPWLRLYKPLPGPAMSLVRLLGRISGKLAVSAKINPDHITRNKDIISALREDQIFHDRISLQLFAEIIDAGENALQNAAKFPIPALLLCPGMDKIVCPQAIRIFSEANPQKFTLLEYPDGYHCLHSDIINKEVMKAMLEFITI
ncbi:MAG: lysophospholipase [Defluviitaleaceae bacterium]|nr:lysophospholipase [Defluviitaleaceae bacterium]